MKLHKEFVQEYKLLGEWAAENDRYLFHIVAKHHMMWHMCLDSRHQNPRFSACWKGEGFCGEDEPCEKGDPSEKGDPCEKGYPL